MRRPFRLVAWYPSTGCRRRPECVTLEVPQLSNEEELQHRVLLADDNRDAVDSLAMLLTVLCLSVSIFRIFKSI
jgi:hypothetical protein